jgi:hypothetical protein
MLATAMITAVRIGLLRYTEKKQSSPELDGKLRADYSLIFAVEPIADPDEPAMSAVQSPFAHRASNAEMDGMTSLTSYVYSCSSRRRTARRK